MTCEISFWRSLTKVPIEKCRLDATDFFSINSRVNFDHIYRCVRVPGIRSLKCQREVTPCGSLPWTGHRRSRIWNPKVRECVHKDPSLDSIFTQLNAVNNCTPYSSSVNFNIHTSTHRFPEWSLPSNVLTILIEFFHGSYMSRQSHSHWLETITLGGK
jgi:hypothetical protein